MYDSDILYGADYFAAEQSCCTDALVSLPDSNKQNGMIQISNFYISRKWGKETRKAGEGSEKGRKRSNKATLLN